MANHININLVRFKCHSIPLKRAQYLSCSWSKGGVPRSCQGLCIPQLSAHYIGILQCPVTLTDSSPCAVIEDLHSSLAGCISTNKTNHWFRSCSVYMWTCLCTYMSMCACVHVCMCGHVPVFDCGNENVICYFIYHTHFPSPEQRTPASS